MRRNRKLIQVRNIWLSYTPLVKKKKTGKLQLFGKKRVVHQALRKVSFDIIPGEILGIIGKNGSGKSTLLRVLGGIVQPDKGKVFLGRRRASLLALNASLMTELTGRENIYLIGLQMGFSRKVINEKYDQIVEFSELDEFIHQPVRTYSSGMRSKLSFSIAVHLATEVMLIDEILSVGDTAFRQKSYAKMQELIKDKRHTVIIVSHDMGRLSQLCNRVLWLEKGRIRMLGNARQVVEEYQAEYASGEGKVLVSDVKIPDLLEVQNTPEGLLVLWASVDDATGYIIYRKQKDKGYLKVGHVPGGMSDRFEDKTVVDGETYQYTVKAYRSYNGISDRSGIQAAGISGTAALAVKEKKN